ncbi:MAG: hypothetical protein PWQ39_491 [Thermacetogenium sp.]|nr:hypothetical protein [Thermacetogenium sp.]
MKELRRQRLQTLARALSGSNALVVVLTKGVSHVDSESVIVISDYDGEVIQGTPATKGECLLHQKASCAHEAAHIRFTDLAAWEEAVRRGLSTLVNILEDARVNTAISEVYLGARDWLSYQNNYFLLNGTWDSIGGAFCAYVLTGKIPKGAPPEARNLIKRCRPHIERAVNAATTWEVLEIAEEVAEILKDYAKDLPQLPQPRGTYTPQVRVSAGRRDAGGKRSKAKPPDPEELKPAPEDAEAPGTGEPAEPEPDGSAEGSAPEEEVDAGSEPRPEEQPESGVESKGDPDAGPDADNPEGQDGSGNADGDAEPQDEPEDQGEPEGQGETDGAEPDPEVGEDGAEEQKENSSDSASGASSAEPEESGERDSAETSPGDSGEESEEYGETDEPEARSDDPDSGSPEEKSEAGAEVEEKCEENPAQGGEADGDGEAQSEAEEKSGGALSGTGGEKAGEEEAEDEDMQDDGELEEACDLEEFACLIKKAEEEAQALDAEEGAGCSPTPPDVDPSEVAKGVKKGIHAGVVFTLKESGDTHMDNFRDTVRSLVRIAAREIRDALLYKSRVPERNLHKGALHSGGLWKVGVYDPRVFQKIRVPSSTPDVALYLLLDCSGSMRETVLVDGSWHPKYVPASEAACLLTGVAEELGIPVAVTGFCDTTSGVIHYPIRKLSGVGSGRFYVYGSNRDGYSIRVATDELLPRSEKRKVLIVVSDGLPNYQIYWGQRGIPEIECYRDTALAVREALKKGVGVIGIHIGETDNFPWVQKIYPHFVHLEKIEQLPKLVARLLKKIILEEGQ